jgi:hypothetical protein
MMVATEDREYEVPDPREDPNYTRQMEIVNHAMAIMAILHAGSEQDPEVFRQIYEEARKECTPKNDKLSDKKRNDT